MNKMADKLQKAKISTMKKKPVNEDSDEFDADEPEEFDESGSDWAPEEDPAGGGAASAKKRRGRPKPTPKKAPPTKKKKVEKKAEPPSDEEEEEDEEEEDEDDGEDSEDSGAEATGNGSFVVLKSDLKEKDPTLWKIDGKALLQKFLPYEEDGKKLYKSTSTYSGWTQSNRDMYAAAPVTFVVQGKKETIIEFHRDQVVLEEKKDEDSETSKSKEATEVEAKA